MQCDACPEIFPRRADSMLKITVCAVGTIKEKYMREGIEDYAKRLSAKCKVTFVEVKECRTVAEEGELLKKAIPSGAFVVALDLKGRMLESTELAEFIDAKMTEGVSSIAFVIGGSDGLDRSIPEKADFSLCLSKMTFTHQMTRLILLEQIYRAMKINSGEKYHK